MFVRISRILSLGLLVGVLILTGIMATGRGVVWAAGDVGGLMVYGNFVVNFDPVAVDMLERASDGFSIIANFGVWLPAEEWSWWAWPHLSDYGVMVPVWLLVVCLSISTFLLYRIERQRKRRRLANYCAHCGYDLTGNQSGVCSECGKRVVARMPKPQ